MTGQGGGFTAVVIIHHWNGTAAAGARTNEAANEAAEQVADHATAAADDTENGAHGVANDTTHDVTNEATHDYAAPVMPAPAVASIEDDGRERTISARSARARLSPTDRMVLDYLRSCVAADGMTRRVALQELCEACGVCRNTARSSLKRLEHQSLAVRQREFSGIQEGCKYRVVFGAGAHPSPPPAPPPMPNADDADRAAPPCAAQDVRRTPRPRSTLRLV